MIDLGAAQALPIPIQTMSILCNGPRAVLNAALLMFRMNRHQEGEGGATLQLLVGARAVIPIR